MSASYRRATESDAAECAALLTQLGYPAPPDAMVRRLAVLVPRDDYCITVAEAGGTLAGVGSVHVFPALHSDHSLALITALVVGEAQRGAGVGAGLVLELEAFAKAAGCDRIIVTTANHRGGAHQFYQRLGYEFTGRRYAKRLG